VTTGAAGPPRAVPAAAPRTARTAQAGREGDLRLYEVLDGGMPLLALQAGHELGFFDALAAGAASEPEMVARTGLPAASVAVLGLAAGALGLVRERDGRLEGSCAAHAYFTSGERSMAPLFAFCRAQPWTAGGYASVREALLDPEPEARGARFWRWIEADPDRLASFAAAMEAHSAPLASRWPSLAPLAEHRELLDLGGGTGAHARAAVTAAPSLHATIVETAAVAELGRARLGAARDDGRIAYRAIDFLSDPLPAADLHLLADVVHDLPEESARKLLRRSFGALPRGGRLLVLEMILDEDRRGPFAAVASAVALFVATGGRQYRRSELTGFLVDAGFGAIESRSVLGCWRLLVARKP
jgi:acetylserotonin N-methyltransferase